MKSLFIPSTILMLVSSLVAFATVGTAAEAVSVVEAELIATSTITESNNEFKSKSKTVNDPPPVSALQKARILHVPPAVDTQNAEFENDSFWEEVGPLLRDAWMEWEDSIVIGDSSYASGAGVAGGPEDRVLDYVAGHVNQKEFWMQFLNPSLAKALRDAFESPSELTEAAVRSLWNPPAPTSTKLGKLEQNTKENSQPPNALAPQNAVPKGVFSIPQLLTPPSLLHLRHLLSLARSSGIPARRPNGMNRNGVIIDRNANGNVHGAVQMTRLVDMVEILVERVVRPMGRILFGEFIGCGDDVDYFAFTIDYDGDGDDDEDALNEDMDASSLGDVSSSKTQKDVELKEHRDASLITLNINLNLPDEEYSGSEVYFREFPFPPNRVGGDSIDSNSGSDQFDGEDGGIVTFSPGMALIHLGAHRHGSLPITGTKNGLGIFNESTSAASNNTTFSASVRGDKFSTSSSKRCNLVIWLFGKDGDVRIAPYPEEERMSVEERWHGCTSHDDAIEFL